MLNQKTGQTPIVKGLAIVTGIMSETSYKPCSLCVNSTNFVILLTGSVNDIKGDCINMANTNNNNTNKGNVITVENSKEVLSSQGLSSKPSEKEINQMIANKAKQDAELKAKQDAELKASELKAKQDAELKAKQDAELSNPAYFEAYKKIKHAPNLIPLYNFPSSNEDLVNCRMMFTDTNFRTAWRSTTENIVIYEGSSKPTTTTLRYQFTIINSNKNVPNYVYTIEQKTTKGEQFKYRIFTSNTSEIAENNDISQLRSGKVKFASREEEKEKIEIAHGKLAKMITEYSEKYSESKFKKDNTRNLETLIKGLLTKLNQIG